MNPTGFTETKSLADTILEKIREKRTRYDD